MARYEPTTSRSIGLRQKQTLVSRLLWQNIFFVSQWINLERSVRLLHGNFISFKMTVQCAFLQHSKTSPTSSRLLSCTWWSNGWLVTNPLSWVWFFLPHIHFKNCHSNWLRKNMNTRKQAEVEPEPLSQWINGLKKALHGVLSSLVERDWLKMLLKWFRFWRQRLRCRRRNTKLIGPLENQLLPGEPWWTD